MGQDIEMKAMAPVEFESEQHSVYGILLSAACTKIINKSFELMMNFS
jgi:hypothetical protein